MGLKHFNYYGYPRDTYRDCMEQIRATNRKRIGILNVWFLAINLLYIFFSYNNVFGETQNTLRLYIIYTAIAAAFEVVLLVFRRFTERIAVWLVYASIAIMMSYSIVIMTVSTRQQFLVATMILVMIVLLAVAYIDQMIRMGLTLSASALIFIWVAYRYKPRSIANQDLYNVLVFLSLALVLHYSFQRVAIQQFVTHQKNVQVQRDLEVKSSFDALTSLLNRGRFMSLAGQVLRQEHTDYMAICLVDLDDFKQINDKLGHQMGDKAIQIAGTTLLETLDVDLTEKWSFTERAVREESNLAGRLGGDEFIVLIRNAGDQAAVRTVLQQILMTLNAAEFGELHGISASLGVTEITPYDKDIDKAYNRADDALYKSKRAGKNQITFSGGA